MEQGTALQAMRQVKNRGYVYVQGAELAKRHLLKSSGEEGWSLSDVAAWYLRKCFPTSQTRLLATLFHETEFNEVNEAH